MMIGCASLFVAFSFNYFHVSCESNHVWTRERRGAKNSISTMRYEGKIITRKVNNLIRFQVIEELTKLYKI